MFPSGWMVNTLKVVLVKRKKKRDQYANIFLVESKDKRWSTGKKKKKESFKIKAKKHKAAGGPQGGNDL